MNLLSEKGTGLAQGKGLAGKVHFPAVPLTLAGPLTLMRKQLSTRSRAWTAAPESGHKWQGPTIRRYGHCFSHTPAKSLIQW